MRRAALIAAMLCAGQMAMATGPAVSERPVQRGGNVVQKPLVLQPGGAIARPAPSAAQEEARERGGLFQSLRPLFRSKRVESEGRASKRARRRGAVCGDLAIQGEAIGKVPGRIRGCGVKDAVRVRSVSGVALSQTSVMDCKTAGALKTWLENSAKPALARKGGGLQSLRVAAHYACRTRNNQKGAKISEHGKGRAIDISGFKLANGSEVTVLRGWNAAGTSKALRRMHRDACGPFGTVLGPNADRFHRDHFHFDTARYRSGSYCR
ncbi:extensin-like domain-containing protein [Sulfitobacter sp. JB4-11]|uniref:extensin-like domain-containing protein n=1 Tax=Sulfitobacter rhodophyticola TaxID=3238304 RepID=UPI00351803AF